MKTGQRRHVAKNVVARRKTSELVKKEKHHDERAREQMRMHLSMWSPRGSLRAPPGFRQTFCTPLRLIDTHFSIHPRDVSQARFFTTVVKNFVTFPLPKFGLKVDFFFHPILLLPFHFEGFLFINNSQ